MPAQATRRRRPLVDDRDNDRTEDDDRPRSRRRDDEDERPAARRRDRDDEEEDRPRGRRRDDEERPAARRRSRDEDEDRPRGRSRDEDDDGERPRGRRRDAADEDERPRERRRGRDDEDDERPAARRKGRDNGEANPGWAAARAVIAESSGFATPLKFTSDPLIVKFLDEVPFDSFRTHWLDDAKGRKKFRCLKNDCPLCDPFGDEANGSSIHFNVVSFEDPDVPVFAYVEAGARLSRGLDGIAEDDRYDGLADPKLYVAISVTGPKKTPEYHCEPVKSRDLYDDWDIDALTGEDYEKFERKKYTGPVEPLPTRRELQDLVKELTSPRR